MTAGSEATFRFADIAGSTALTDAHGDEPALQLVDDFPAVVRAELPKIGGEYVKTVDSGDPAITVRPLSLA